MKRSTVANPFTPLPNGNHMLAFERNHRSNVSFAANRKAAVSVLFAIMVVPLLLITGIAIDFSFYIEAQAQLNLAADAAAMHAVRAASLASQAGAPNTGGVPSYQYAGVLAGQQWFAAQAEPVPGVALTGTVNSNGSGNLPAVNVTVSYTAPTYTATVTYSGTINTVFGRLAGVRTWPIAGTATSVLSNNYVDIGIMIDNSQSMLIGATTADINTMNALTPCAVVSPTITATGAVSGLAMSAYGYYLNGPGSTYGQGALGYNYGQTLPTFTGVNGPAPNPSTQYCDPNYLPGCAYPPGILYGPTGSLRLTTTSGSNKAGACNNGGGAPGAAGPNTPQAPCAFACHQLANGGDWYALARTNNVTLRLDLVQNAAQTVISTMEQYSPGTQSLLGVGVYTFNSSFQPVYPCTSLTGCPSPFGTNLAAAYADLAVCTGTQTSGCLLPPITGDSPETDFPAVFSQAATFLAGTAGNGASPATAVKDLFLITDGITDWNLIGNQISPSSTQGTQTVGPIDQLQANICQQLKNQGITLYVLYTPYEPLPTWTYSYTTMPQTEFGVSYPSGVTYPNGVTLQNFVTETDPSSFPDYNANYPTDTPVQAALRACASSPSNFYTASSQADINTALQTMLSSALNSAARITQ
jgi:Flp pilus assembly protein TadG